MGINKIDSRTIEFKCETCGIEIPMDKIEEHLKKEHWSKFEFRKSENS